MAQAKEKLLFDKILIANRGEIACRIMRTAQGMGIHCVAIYSDADVNALHVKQADSAYRIGPAASRKSYLNIQAIIDTALICGAQAIHPGYGFLAENAEFAELCENASITFIGPPSSAIRAMGSKSAAKQLLSEANIPILPGYQGKQQSLKVLKQAASQIGYPLLIKPAAGGGGKGMHIVWQEQDLEDCLTTAKREALSSFNDEEVILEKYLINPRHIEVQIFADQQGQCIHLYERDCSIQRRYQKIIEEAPAPHIDNDLRQRMTQAAINVAKAINYVGAGTIELLVDANQQFYFMEMNTRLQVEHPVTEQITGLDLVEWQIRIAKGQPLPLTQAQIQVKGHAIEARIYAEDPEHHFLPSCGSIHVWQIPKECNTIRFDSGVTVNSTVTPYYDPMLAKVIAWGETRSAAIKHLQQALQLTVIVGLKSNIHFIQEIITHSDYQAANCDTDWINRHINDLTKPISIPNEVICLASLFSLRQKTLTDQKQLPTTPWQQLIGWRLFGHYQKEFRWKVNDAIVNALLKIYAKEYCEININGINYQITMKDNKDKIECTINDKTYITSIIVHDNEYHVLVLDQHYVLTSIDVMLTKNMDSKQTPSLSAPLPGTVVALLAKPGAQVKQGSKLMVIEAMKMEHAIYAPFDGQVDTFYFKVGDLVKEGTDLLAFSTQNPK